MTGERRANDERYLVAFIAPARCALGPIIIRFRAHSRGLSTRCSVRLRPNAHSEVVSKRPDRRLALDAPFCLRWRVASSRWLPLTLQLTMIVLSR